MGMPRATTTFGLYPLFLLFVASASSAQQRYHPRCGADVHVDDRSGLIPLPQGDLFCPLLADPKAEHSYLSYLRGDFATLADPTAEAKTNIGSIGLGDSFGLIRIPDKSGSGGLQLDLMGAIFAQFNLDTESFDLINADYLVGVPVSFRASGFSTRLRFYHQSSHLGDEFLLSRMPERENLSFEAVELMLSQEIGGLRVYAGGESYFRRRPAPQLVPRLGHTGVELRPATFGSGRLVAALDLKIIDDVDWQLSWSARAGIEIARAPSAGHPARVLSLLAEYYDGSAPYGQFYRDNIRYFGAGIHFTL
jgi:hypothetical protein